MTLCDKCISGVRHEGTPEGKVEIINGVQTYVATPTGDYAKDKVVLFMTDVFGINISNNQLLIDDFARHGFKTYGIDYLNDDPMPPHVLEPGTKFDFMAWLAAHDQKVTRPFIDKVIDGLKEQGVTQFAATGYCFGGRYVFDLALDKVIKVGAVSHPSGIQYPDDLHAFKKTEIPLLMNSCERDQGFPLDAQKQADEIFAGGAMESALYKREYFPGCDHGFAVRGDMSKPEVKAGKEGAFKACVEFFSKHL